jgi:hypothetical protein
MGLGTLLRLGWDRLSAAILIGVGAVAVILGWIGVSGADLPSKQLPYLVSGGIGGLYILGVAAVLWLSGDLRDEWSRLGEIKTMLSGLAATDVDPEVLAQVEPLRTDQGHGARGVTAQAR